MAFPKAVNDQITDPVNNANVKELGDAPAVPMGNLYQATAQALANAAHNATTAQDEAWVEAQAATTASVETLLSLDVAATGKATEAVRHGTVDQVQDLGPTPRGHDRRQASDDRDEAPDTLGGAGVRRVEP